jgi:hypothetical protein
MFRFYALYQLIERRHIDFRLFRAYFTQIFNVFHVNIALNISVFLFRTHKNALR